jgi:hypothetical protein
LVVSTVHVREAAALVFPALSTARTSNVWTPSANDVNDRGLVHDAHAPPSSRHSYPATPLPPVSVLPLNAKLADELSETDPSAGPEVIEGAVGLVVSTVHDREATALAFPALSTARTSNVRPPSANAVSDSGLVHDAHAPPSTRHSYPATPLPPVSVLPLNAKLADELSETDPSDGPELIDGADGFVVSTVHVRVASALVFPALSTARTSKVCSSSVSDVSD